MSERSRAAYLRSLGKTGPPIDSGPEIGAKVIVGRKVLTIVAPPPNDDFRERRDRKAGENKRIKKLLAQKNLDPATREQLTRKLETLKRDSDQLPFIDASDAELEQLVGGSRRGQIRRLLRGD